MATKPYFSIITPTLNEAEYIPNLLSDLERQTYQNFEVIVVDAQSSDSTVSQVQQFRSHLPSLTLLESKVKNVSAQRNAGANPAKGNFLLFIDADSQLPAYYLEGLRYRLISTDTQVFTTWCLPDSDEPGDRTITTLINLQLEATALLNAPTAYGTMIGISRSLYHQTQGFDPNIPFAEDSEFVRRACKHHPFVIFRDPKYVFSLRRFRKTGKLKSLQKFAQMYLKILVGSPLDQAKDYPMGGNADWNKTTENSLFAHLETNIKKISKNKRVSRIIKALATLTEPNGHKS